MLLISDEELLLNEGVIHCTDTMRVMQDSHKILVKCIRDNIFNPKPISIRIIFAFSNLCGFSWNLSFYMNKKCIILCFIDIHLECHFLRVLKSILTLGGYFRIGFRIRTKFLKISILKNIYFLCIRVFNTVMFSNQIPSCPILWIIYHIESVFLQKYSSVPTCSWE